MWRKARPQVDLDTFEIESTEKAKTRFEGKTAKILHNQRHVTRRGTVSCIINWGDMY